MVWQKAFDFRRVNIFTANLELILVATNKTDGTICAPLVRRSQPFCTT
jgi:hypothetical protein